MVLEGVRKIRFRTNPSKDKELNKKDIEKVHTDIAKEIDSMNKKKDDKDKKEKKTGSSSSDSSKKTKSADKKQKRLDEKKKAKETKIREKERLKRKKERQKELKKLEKQKNMLEKRKAKEAKLKEKEKSKKKEKKEEKKKKTEPTKQEEKKTRSFLRRKKFDQSEIEIVKKHDVEQESINLRGGSELKEIMDGIHEGDVIYERTGFGWKGQGSRRIIYDEALREYIYEVIEPSLTVEEEDIRKKLVYYFRTKADTDVFNMSEKEKTKYLGESLDKIVKENHLKLEGKSKDKVYYYMYQDFLGYGKIDILMHDEGIEDISCDGINVPIFIFHRHFDSIRSNIAFKDVDELDSFVVKLSQMCGKQISVYEPIVDGKLEDGSRLQTTLSNTITKYSTFTIRRFREDPLTPIDLIENNTMSLEMAAYFWLVIEKGTNILFCGGTASGKTTALNALSLFLPAAFKIVSIEDTREINLPHENWIAGTTRTGFASTEDFKTGKDIDMFDLIKVALRQRPKVIIVGEVRGKEAYTLFQAMTTGHLSYSTVHASDLHSLIQRLENKPIDLPRALLTSLDLIVFLNSVTISGQPVRRITTVTEVIKLDPESNRLVTLTPFSWMSEVDDRFESTGGSRILNTIKLQNGWTDAQLKNEVENRKKILRWMIKTNERSYQQVGRIVSEYKKNPELVLKRIKEDKK